MIKSPYKKKDRKRPPDDIIVLAIICINSEITQNMRAIALEYEYDKAKFVFYLDKTPTETEKENSENIATNFDAGHPTKLKHIDIEFIVTNEPFGKLEPLDFMLYRRYEEQN